MKEKEATFGISANLEQDGQKRVVINGYYLMQFYKTLLGKERFKVVAQFKTAPDAVAALNKLLGYKEK